MAYGLSTRAPMEDETVKEIAVAQSTSSNSRSWQALSAPCRLQLIERALRAANDRIDGFPMAL